MAAVRGVDNGFALLHTDSMKAGFGVIDITPPRGTLKQGWMQRLPAEIFLDPLYARAAVFAHDGKRIAFIQLDTLSIRWTQVDEIRRRITRKYGFPGAHIMVSATHNHAGPAVSGLGNEPRDERYIARLTEDCVEVFGRALEACVPARLGFNWRLEFDVAHNRRVRMRDGTSRCQVMSSDPGFLAIEGPEDPEVAVLAARDEAGRWLGCLVNYACHPTHHGGTHEISAGFPGVMAARLKEAGCPAALFLNGAYGNLISLDFARQTRMTKEQAGHRLADDVLEALRNMEFFEDWPLFADQVTVRLDYRAITDDAYHGRDFGAQRFRPDAYYQAAIDRIREIAAQRGHQPAEVQLLGIGDVGFVGIPAEYFVEFQLRIKEEAWPRHALVVGGANGMVGYVPTIEAFRRGGYETTLGPPSKVAPGSGEKLAEAAIGLLKTLPEPAMARTLRREPPGETAAPEERHGPPKRHGLSFPSFSSTRPP